MKKNYRFLTLAFVLSAAFIISSCKKDDDETKNPYYGKWQSKVYQSKINPALLEKMVFDFTNTTFEDKVSQGLSADALQPAAGIKGDVLYTAPATIDAEINEVSVAGQPYIDKSVDEATFNAAFGATLGALLNEEFTATFQMVGDSMVFNLPLKNNAGTITIILGKVQ